VPRIQYHFTDVIIRCYAHCIYIIKQTIVLLIVTFRCIDDVLSLNNSKTELVIYVDPIYPIELEIKGTTETARLTSYFDIHLETDSEGQVRTNLYYKTDGINFLIVNFPLICINIPSAGFYYVYLSLCDNSELVVSIMISLIEGYR
jgi:hypothetical protein